MADKTRLREQIRAEQDDFVALLRGLTDEQWAAPSLCAGWTVRDAAIHTAWHVHLRPADYARDLPLVAVLGLTKFDTKQLARDGARSNDSPIDWLASPRSPA